MKKDDTIKLTDKDGNFIAVSREDYLKALLAEVRENKDNPEQLFYIGYALINEEFYDEAIEVFTMARDKNPEELTYDNAIGVCYLQMGRYEEAKEFYKHHLQKFPNSALGYLNIAKACDYLHQEQEMVENLKKSIELNPNFYNSLLYWILYCKETKALEEGINYLLEIAKRGENIWGPYLILALEAEEQGDLIAAEEYAEKALMRNVDNGNAFADLSALFGKIGKLDRAIQILEARAMTTELSFKEIWNLAVAYLESGKSEDAKLQIQKLYSMAQDSESKALVDSLIEYWKLR